MADAGIVSVIPTLMVLAFAIWTKRTVEPLLAGVIIGLLILEPTKSLDNLTGIMLSVMADETIGWVILVCGLMGALIALLVKIGGAVEFGKMVATRIKSGTSALLMAWLLGLLIFIDDYLNTLTISSSMKKVTDKYRVSREMLAYVVDSTAAPICVLIPLSTWAVYFSAVLEESLNIPVGEGFALYLQAIPYMFYAWFAVILVPLVILKKVPLLGAMKTAEHKMRDHYNIAAEPVIDEAAGFSRRGVLLNFIIPIATLIFFTWYLDIDILKGVIIALLVTLALSFSQRILALSELFDTLLEGFKSMLLPLATVVAGFMLKEVNDQLGLTVFVIETMKPLMTAHWLPLVTFITMALIAFATGSFWGIFAVATPIVMPLAISVDANLPLVIGALISASVFGSHACFYGDSTVLSAHGSGCSVMAHALTQLPYVLLAASIASVAFIVLAW
ncbi:sodium:proton antiporter [Dasania sp. GY-MA-18]|uniref:Sodium:proton antiporter n=1 Tax=Dasania phycosphaerae TaxID=2950436 RepID=A0A9J6RLH4_9GAMM|nr:MULTISPECIES: Na+/H+ antiporter NhaC family protein [Dasania]MCR8922626.1 sodium:proton antiporter [Dasania sp. GY-MA-18]MCZ0865056.1 sodium:proton antiporter [Dasania phycosphaerae]MCZ0868782.1 sodium:proton antiporter [Dasania phycosphaerae]